MPLDHRFLLFLSTLVVAFSSPPIFSQSANKLLTRHAERESQKKKKKYDHRFSGQQRPHALQLRHVHIKLFTLGGLQSDFIIPTRHKKLFRIFVNRPNYILYITEKKIWKIFLDSRKIRQKTEANIISIYRQRKDHCSEEKGQHPEMMKAMNVTVLYLLRQDGDAEHSFSIKESGNRKRLNEHPLFITFM